MKEYSSTTIVLTSGRLTTTKIVKQLFDIAGFTNIIIAFSNAIFKALKSSLAALI